MQVAYLFAIAATTASFLRKDAIVSHMIRSPADISSYKDIVDIRGIFKDSNVACARWVYIYAMLNKDHCKGWAPYHLPPPRGVVVSILAAHPKYDPINLTGETEYAPEYECHVAAEYYGCSKEVLQYGVRWKFENICPFSEDEDVRLVPWIDYSPVGADLRATIYCVHPRELQDKVQLQKAVDRLAAEEIMHAAVPAWVYAAIGTSN